MTNIINIDHLADQSAQPAQVAVRTGGKVYEMKPPTVGELIALLGDMKVLAQATDVQEQVEVMIRIISRSFPGLTPETLHGWTLPQLERMMAVVQGIDPDAPPEAGKTEPVTA